MGVRQNPENAWTDERLALLRKLYEDKVQFGHIAGEINKQTGSTFTRNSICGMCYRLRFPPRKRSRKQRAAGPSERILSERRRQATRLNIKRVDNSQAVARRKVIADFDQLGGPDHLGIAFFDLERHHCRFPKGEGIEATYCGQDVKEDSYWCNFHHSLVYQPPENRPVRRAA
jgi:hypothetical protein